ncbi:MAG TPA: two-component regulator propeller domain-containing protein [Prolixibacteraceae bacterium]|nr:two-component regulator propeller domain-containing protein [Prolixibacteraceae bacterium]
MNKISLQLTILFIITWFNGFANFQQPANYHFQYLKVEDGLPQNTINAIARDYYGFMWFGTNNGICRYDGFTFESFKSEKDQPGSLPDNMISAIEPDEDHRLWVGSANGLSYFDPQDDRIVEFSTQENGCQQITRVSTIVVHSGKIWVGTSDNGIFLLSHCKSTGNYELVSHFCEQENNLPENGVSIIYKTKDNTLWAGTNQGIYIYSETEKKFNLFTANQSIAANVNVYDIFESSKGDLYIGTFNGLAVIRRNRGSASWFFPDVSNPNALVHGTVGKISEDIRGGILVGTLGGLQSFDLASGNFYLFPENGPDYFKLNNQFISTIYCDSTGNVWVGTEKGGINKFNVYQKPFSFYANDPNNQNSLNDNTINSVLKERDFLWIGTAGGGLNSVDLRTGKFTHYRYSAFNNQTLSSDYISSILRGPDGNLWIGSWGGGLTCLKGASSNPTIQRITATTPGYRYQLVDNFVSTLWDDNRGFLVVGAQGGLSMLTYNKHKFTTLVAPNSSERQISEVGCILKDSKDYYWVGTRNGLFRFPANSLKETDQPELIVDNLQFFTNSESDSLSLPGHYIISLIEDSKGNVWAGTYGNGFCKIAVQKDGTIRCTSYSQNDGLSNNVTYCILEDHFGNLWISTDYGLSMFDTKHHKFKNFYKQDGLLNNQFYWSASYKSNDGELYFGGTEGLNYFKPENVQDFQNLVTPRITRLKIFNQEVKAGSVFHGKKVICRPIYDADTIYLSFRDNNISFDFSSLDYNLPEKTSFAYMILGIDKDWNYVPAQRRFANYSNLKGGTYPFLIKASNGDGVWNDKPTEITIVITPPFWKTRWFTILMIVSVVLITFFIVQLQMQSIIRQKKMLEEKVVVRTQKIEDQKVILEKQAAELIESNQKLERRQIQIEQQKKELEDKNNEISSQRDELIVLNNKVEEVNQKQLSFFTNISHEFRTPLTLIISPLERMLSKFKGDTETENMLNILNRNAQRLLLLINQLLEIRKVETGNQELRVEKSDTPDFLLEIFDSFVELAEKNEIEYTHQIDIAGETWIDKEKLENVLYNLLSNAFKFTPRGGRITLKAELSTEGNDQYLRMVVSDSGIGIPQQQIGRLFDRFFQVTESKNHKYSGTGIGLSLVKSLTEIMYGNVEVESEPGKGSEFIVTIPVNRQFFANHEIDISGQVFESGIRDKVAILYDQIVDSPQTGASDGKTDLPVVLVIEDNQDMRSYISFNLKKNFVVLEAENGKEGFELARREEIELILSDVMMPEMDGFELCRKIKGNLYTSHIPLVLLTAKGEVEDFLEGLGTGADDYISKPFNMDVLIAKISGIIENRRKLKKKFSSLEDVTPAELTSSKLDEQFFTKINELIEIHYTDPKFDVDTFASKMYVSRSQLYKKLKAITDLSTNDYLTVFRLKKSVELLKKGEMQISEIAYNTGFNDPKYFSRVFKKYFQCTPSEYVLKFKN